MRPEIWSTLVLIIYKKDFFCFFEKVIIRAARLEKLPCDVDFRYILLFSVIEAVTVIVLEINILLTALTKKLIKIINKKPVFN